VSKYQHRRPSIPGARTGAPWSPEEDDRLLAELARGMTHTQIAEAHGRSRNAIELRAERVKSRPTTGRSLPAPPPWPYSQPVTNRRNDPQTAVSADYSNLEKRIVATMSVADQVAMMANRPSKGVNIGSAFEGKAGFADTRSGAYWETLPKIEGDCLRLQVNTLYMAEREKARLKRKGKYRGHE